MSHHCEKFGFLDIVIIFNGLAISGKKTITTRAVIICKAGTQEPFGVTLTHCDGFDLPNGSRLVENGFEDEHNFPFVLG